MKSRYDAELNGVSLKSISSKILILDISYSPTRINYNRYAVAKRKGSRIYQQEIDYTDVVVSFAIRAYSVQERQTICNAVQKWAKNGGIFQTNDRPNQRLRCVLTSPPTITSVMKWTDPISMTFTAYNPPFWEEATPVTYSMSSNGSGSIYVPGSVNGSFWEANITPNSSTLTNIELTANGNIMTLEGISVAAGSTIKITYDDYMIQHIAVGSTSLLNKRHGVDDLPVLSGETNRLQVQANTASTVVFKARGTWL